MLRFHRQPEGWEGDARVYMKCISWNVRGLRNVKRRSIVVCLQETWLEKYEPHDWRMVGRDILEGYHAVNATGRSGGVLIAWNEGLYDKEDLWDGQFVAAVKLSRRSDGLEVVVTSVYGPVYANRWERLWEELDEVVDRFNGTPLLFGGDFNVTLEVDDRPDGAGGRDQGSEEFWDFLSRATLREMGPQDSRYTWRSEAGPSYRSRLDRFLCSVELLERFLEAIVLALPRPISDHCPIIWQTQEGHGCTTYFKLDKSWLGESGFKEEIMEVWRSHTGSEMGSKNLTGCIERVRGYLMMYRRRIRESRCKVRVEALAKIRELDDVEDSRRLIASEMRERRKWRLVVANEDKKEEMDWRQRSRQVWLKEGDANTCFFHLAANGRRRMNQILRLRVGTQQHSGLQAMGRALTDHFWAMTRRGGPSRWRWAGRGASQLTTVQRDALIRPFTVEEVYSAIAGLNGEGAPGPDGLPVFFYKEFWALVKGDVMATMEELRSPQANMERINKSYLFMLPKRQGAESVNDYRPISLSNSIYLIVAKVLANRLKEVIGELIGPFQYAFIPGRQLPDSVVMAGEILAAWKEQGTKGFMWKVDFAKAYDSLDWRYL